MKCTEQRDSSSKRSLEVSHKGASSGRFLLYFSRYALAFQYRRRWRGCHYFHTSPIRASLTWRGPEIRILLVWAGNPRSKVSPRPEFCCRSPCSGLVPFSSSPPVLFIALASFSKGRRICILRAWRNRDQYCNWSTRDTVQFTSPFHLQVLVSRYVVSAPSVPDPVGGSDLSKQCSNLNKTDT